MHILNCAPRKGFDWKTPYELVFGRKPEVSHICIFGCRAWVIDDKANKWDPRSTPMVFVGYEMASKAHRLWDPMAHKIVVSANVKFDESVLPNKPIPPTPTKTASSSRIPLPPPLRASTIEIPWFSVDEEPKPKPASTNKGKQREHQLSPSPLPPSSPSCSSNSESDINQHYPPPKTPTPPRSPTPPPPPSTPPNQSMPRKVPDAPKRSKRTTKPVQRYKAGSSNLQNAETEVDDLKRLELFENQYCHLVELYTATSAPNEPKIYEQAIASADTSKWKAAMAEEIKTLEDCDTWIVLRTNP